MRDAPLLGPTLWHPQCRMLTYLRRPSACTHARTRRTLYFMFLKRPPTIAARWITCVGLCCEWPAHHVSAFVLQIDRQPMSSIVADPAPPFKMLTGVSHAPTGHLWDTGTQEPSPFMGLSGLELWSPSSSHLPPDSHIPKMRAQYGRLAPSGSKRESTQDYAGRHPAKWRRAGAWMHQ